MDTSPRLAALVAAAALALAGCSAAPAPAPTPNSIAEYRAQYTDWATRYVECSRRHGADTKLAKDGAITQAVAPGRPTSGGFDADCVAELGRPPQGPPASPTLLKGMYLLLVDQAGCLRGAGYQVSDPPSMQAWVENYSGDSWNPLRDINDQGIDIGPAMAICPQPDEVDAERVGARA